MQGELTVPVATVQRAFGEAVTSLSPGAALLRGALPRLALHEFRRVIRDNRDSPGAWTPLLEYFLEERLLCSALALVREIDARGGASVVSAVVRERLSPCAQIPPVALYIPCFNAAQSLRQVLQAVRRQSVRPQQVIVVDDRSTDATAEIAAEFSEVEVVRHEVNQGVGAARNSALAVVRHPLVASLDSDVVADEFWLERLLVAMVEAPLVGVFGALVERNAVRLPDRWRARVMPLLYPGEGDIDDAVLYGSNTLFTTAALRAVGGYDPRYTRAFDDTDLGNKLRAAGLHIRYVSRAVCEHTRRDSMQAVLSSCYAYRRERAVKERLFDRSESLEMRWNALLRDGIAEIEALGRSGAAAVAFPSLLNIFWSIARDLSEFLGVRDDDARRGYAATARGALHRAVGEIPGLSVTVSEAIRRALEPVEGELLQGREMPVVSEDLVTQLYERCFEKVGVVLQFPLMIRTALEHGAVESLAGDQGIEEKPLRFAVVDCGYLLGDSDLKNTGCTLDSARCESFRSERADIALFESVTILHDPRQRAAALKGYRPTQVILVGVDGEPDTIARAYLRLREWCGEELPPVAVVGTSVRLEELSGVEFTAEEPESLITRHLASR